MRTPLSRHPLSSRFHPSSSWLALVLIISTAPLGACDSSSPLDLQAEDNHAATLSGRPPAARSATSLAQLDQEVDHDGYGSAYGVNGEHRVAQTFTAGISGPLIHVELFLRLQNAIEPGNPFCWFVPSFCFPGPGTLRVELRSVNQDGSPGTLVLSEGSLPQSHFSESNDTVWEPVAMSPGVELTAGTKYALVVYSTSPGGRYYWHAGPWPDSYPGGNLFLAYAQEEWAPEERDAAFRTFVVGEAAARSIRIDLLPGKKQNVVSLKKEIEDDPHEEDDDNGRGGRLAVAILSSPTFDALTIDPGTVTLGDGVGAETPVALRNGRDGRPRAKHKDVDKDGLMDLVLRFEKAEMVANGDLTPASVELVLQARDFGGTRFLGSDAISIKAKK